MLNPPLPPGPNEFTASEGYRTVTTGHGSEVSSAVGVARGIPAIAVRMDSRNGNPPCGFLLTEEAAIAMCALIMESIGRIKNADH